MAYNETFRVANEVVVERIRQREAESWSEDHDDLHTVNDWVALIVRYSGRAMDAAEMADVSMLYRPVYRRRLVQVAAIAVAAVESLDRVEAVQNATI